MQCATSCLFDVIQTMVLVFNDKFLQRHITLRFLYYYASSVFNGSKIPSQVRKTTSHTKNLSLILLSLFILSEMCRYNRHFTLPWCLHLWKKHLGLSHLLWVCMAPNYSNQNQSKEISGEQFITNNSIDNKKKIRLSKEKHTETFLKSYFSVT